jgi:hypothetical protein
MKETGLTEYSSTLGMIAVYIDGPDKRTLG